ncbi:hypothetical protein [Kribbella sp. NPDC049227]|uniref:hypothetical protein n=1 Tax=Kribbella sp. NPDC049227 TaxID=3364113 RepID=UPI0037139D7C
METNNSAPRPVVRRSKAWVYYAVLSVGALIAMPALGWWHALLAALGCGIYSAYLFRGGRVVIWFW